MKLITTIPSNSVHSEIRISSLNNGLWQVEKDIEYKVCGGTIVVPQGFITDLASVPECMSSIGFPTRGLWDSASILHDFLYSKKCSIEISREDCDKLFLKTMLNCGVSKTVAYSFYKAVRLFGEPHYEKQGQLCEKKAIWDYTSSQLEYKKRIKKLFPLIEEDDI